MADNPLHGATLAAMDITQLVAEHHEVLYRYAYRLTGRQADAEDLTQQTYLQAQTSLHQLRDPAAARGWLFTILRNCCQKVRRQRMRFPIEPVSPDIDAIPDAMAVETPIDPERLQHAIDELPETFKSVVLMYYFEECSYKEIAARLDLPLGTVMSRLSRAKSHLRQRLFELEALPPSLGRPQTVPSSATSIQATSSVPPHVDVFER